MGLRCEQEAEMLKVLAWLEKLENSPEEVFLRFVEKQEPRLRLPLELVPETDRDYEYIDRQIQLERLQHKFFWPPEPGCGPW
jgi:hypothetical protein